MFRLIGTAPRSAASNVTGFGSPSSSAADHLASETSPRRQSTRAMTPGRLGVASRRGRRKDDATFIAIAALLAIFFAVQGGWVVAQQERPEAGISRT